MTNREHGTNLDRYAGVSIGTSLVTMGLKAAGFFLTASVGLLADALESTINVAAGVLVLAALRGARRPADRNHTYGHGKIEFLASGLEGGLIVAAAVGIAWAAWERVQQPVALSALGAGIVFVVAAALLNAVAAVVLLRAGRRFHSLVLEADARHLMTDVVSSVGLVVALGGMVVRPQWWFLDPAVAFVLAVHIAWTGAGIVFRSVQGLLDVALEAEEVDAICATLDEAGVQYHALRTRRSGQQRFVDFHLVVPGGMSVEESHALCSRLEEAIAQRLPNTQTVIHVEPQETEMVTSL
jgi:cation diffusion facilitator family transporter